MFNSFNNQPQPNSSQQQQNQNQFMLNTNQQQQQQIPSQLFSGFLPNQGIPPQSQPQQQSLFANQPQIPVQNCSPISQPPLFNPHPNIFGQPQQPQQPQLPQQYQQYQNQSLFGAPQIQPFTYKDDEQIEPQKEDAKLQKQIYDLESNLKFEVRSQYKMGKLLSEKTQYLPSIVSLRTNDAAQNQNDAQPRVGVDLICLIDKSGSMQGQKIQMVHQTLNLLLDLLTDNDRLQLITFDSDARRLTPLKRVTDGNKQYFKQMIASISAGGGTRISTATQIAFTQLQQRQYRNNVSSLFLLSDGQDGSAEQAVKQQLESVDEVFTLHSFGFGQDHDAKLMTALCNLRNGSFYFVQDITLLDEFFADALGGLMSVVGEQLEVNIKCYPQEPYQNIQIHKTYGKMWTQTKQNREYKINLPQIASGTRKDFVFELGLPQFNVQIGDNQRQALIIEAELKMKNSSNGQIIVKKCSLTLTFFNLDEKINNNEEDIDVAAQYYRVKGADVIDDARRACEQNKHEDAQKLIDNMITSIQRNEKVALKSAGIIQDLQQAKQGSTRQNYGMFGQQQMCQMASNNYQQQGVNAMFSALGCQMQQQAPALYQNQVQYQMMQKVQQSKPQSKPF